MPLDFHVAQSAKDAPYMKPFCSFEMGSHELIFYRFGLPDGQFSLFKRMLDYYSDAVYAIEELPDFIVEVNDIRSLFLDNKQLVEQLDVILLALQDASRRGWGVWVYCD